MNIIINSHVFKKQHENLLHLSTAIEAAGDQVSKLFNDIPDKLHPELGDKFGEQFNNINSLLYCLSVMAQGSANDAEGWEDWARKENIKILFKG